MHKVKISSIGFQDNGKEIVFKVKDKNEKLITLEMFVNNEKSGECSAPVDDFSEIIDTVADGYGDDVWDDCRKIPDNLSSAIKYLVENS